MSRKRKQAAAVFRHAVARSNELHAEYLEDRKLYESYERFTRWQFEYMLPFFDDLLESEGYAEAVDFIVSDLCGVGVGERDHDIERATPVIVRTLPVHALELAASAAELNAGALEVNLAICRELIEDGALPTVISETEYCIACRATSSYDECMSLVGLGADLGEGLNVLVRVPMIGALLKTMRLPARATGFGALQEFLETGYITFRRISDIERFLELLHARLDQAFQRIYCLPLE